MSALVALPHATSISAALAGWLFSIVWGLVGGVLFIFRRPQSMALENAELRTEN
jgi:hypothetical protein